MEVYNVENIVHKIVYSVHCADVLSNHCIVMALTYE